MMPRIEDILFIAIFFAVLGLGPRLMNMDGDLGRHLTIGNYILETKSIPTKDIFSHTMQGLSLTPHEWLAQLIFAISYRVGGLDGVIITCALLIAITFTLVYRQSVNQSNMILLSIGMTLVAAAAASIHWLARPHLFTMLFAVFWIGELESWRTTGRFRWWSLPLMMLVWVNLHGAFIVGILIWSIYIIDLIFTSRHRRTSNLDQPVQNKDQSNGKLKFSYLLLVGIVVLLTSLLNPDGWHIWKTTFGFLNNQYLVSNTVEYQSPNFQQINTWPFLGMICLSILILSFHRGKVAIAALLLLTCWTAFGLVSARNIAIYAVLAAPLLAGFGAKVLRDNWNKNPLVTFDRNLLTVDKNLKGHIWPIVAVVILGFMLLNGVKLDQSRIGNNFSENVFPVKAVDWVLEQPDKGPVFNYFPWGGYLLYRAWPEQLVFIDGQTDFYGEELTRQYEKVITLDDGWEGILEHYGIEWVIMPVESPLTKQLEKMASWEESYRDSTAAIFFAAP